MTLTCQWMRKKGLLCFLVMTFLIQSQYATAQQITKTFKGVATNDKGEPVSGATVVVKGTNFEPHDL